MNNIIQLITVASAYLVLFALIPFWLRGYRLSGGDTLDRLAGSFLLSHVAIILTVLLLSLAGIYNRITLITALILLAAGYRYVFKRKESSNAFRNFKRGLNNFIGGYYHPRVIIRDLLNGAAFFFRSVKQKIKSPMELFFTLMIFGYAAYTRCYHSIVNMFYGVSDMYLHTEWIKFLTNNRPFIAGVYPFGFHGVIAAISDVFGINIVTVMRMFGPVSGMLTVLSLYYLLKRVMRSGFAVNLALAVYIVSDLFPFWATERQGLALTQEFGTVFLYPTAYFLYIYLKEKKTRSLVYFSACVSLTLLIHFFVTIYAILICAAVFAACLAYLDRKVFVRLVAGVICAFIVAFLPLGVGLAKGIEFNGSMNWALSFFMGEGEDETVQETVVETQPPASVSGIIDFISDNGYFDRSYNMSLLNLNWLLPYLAAGILAFVSPAFKPKRGGRSWILAALSIYSLGVLLLFILAAANIFSIMEFSRLYSFFIFSVPLVIGIPFEILHMLLYESGKKARAAYIAVIAAAGSAAVCWAGVNKRFMPLGRVWQAQYNGAVKAYYDIIREFPKNQWIIVSSFSEYSLCLFEGYHYETAQFIKDLDNGEGLLQPPSENVFLYVVKRPNTYLDTELQQLGAFVQLPEPDENDLYADLTEAYENGLLRLYRDIDANRALQAKAGSWAKEYMKYFPEEMSVYYEDDEIIVYRVEQNTYALNNFNVPYPGRVSSQERTDGGAPP